MAPFYKAVNVRPSDKTLNKGKVSVYVGDIDPEWLVAA